MLTLTQRKRVFTRMNGIYQITCSAVVLLLGCGTMSASPLAYMVTTTEQFGTIDLGTGTFTDINSSEGVELAGLGVANGNLYGANYENSAGELYEINPATGNLTSIGGSGVQYAAFGSTLTGLYAVSIAGALAGEFVLYSINPSNGAATQIGSGTGIFPSGNYNLSTNSGTLYFEDGGATPSLFTISTTTGLATLVGATGGPEMGGMVTIGGTLYGGETFPAALVDTLNTSSGAATTGSAITGNTGIVGGLAPDPVPSPATPEPGTWLLLGTGFSALTFLRRRQ